MIIPVKENEATADIRQKYEEIKKALQSQSVPIFFTYIAPFPDYFTYIIDQLTKNMEDKRFKDLSLETGQTIRSIIRSTLTQSEEYQQWVQRYSHHPGFYNFEKDNEHIFRINVILTFIFIALRETVKGWAIAAKKLAHVNITDISDKSSSFKEGSTIYEDVITSKEIILKSSALTKQDTKAVEIYILHEFLQLCQADYTQFTKKEEFLIMRVGLERIILSSLPLFPNLIFSPINVVLKLTMKYHEFPELLYLLSEQFPTLAMQRMIFSGYMLTK